MSGKLLKLAANALKGDPKNRRGSGAKRKTVILDDTELSLYGGK